MPIALPKSYLDARRRLGGREIHLDESKLGRRPRVWPGLLFLYKADVARRENLELRPSLDERLADRLFVIGTNTAGLLFVIDDGGRVGLLDDCELGEKPTALCGSFEELARCFVTAKAAQEELKQKEYDARLRQMPSRWKRLDEVIEGRHPRFRPSATYAMLVDMVYDYQFAGRADELSKQLSALRKRHPGKARTLIDKLRKDNVLKV